MPVQPPDLSRFTRWLPLDSPGPFPGAPGIVQCKVDRLLDYPAGRSAMVFYGAGDVDGLVGRLSATLPSLLPDDRLLVRYRPAANPDAECEGLLARFERRFGAPPLLQGELR